MINQVKQCPSGALSFVMNGEENTVAPASAETEIEIVPNGPLLLKGDCVIKQADGSVVSKTTKTAFCRCGASTNKPFCDGTHREN